MFLIKFFAIFAILHLIIWTMNLGFLENGLAELTGKTNGLSVEGNRVYLNEGEFFVINPSCTGLVSVSIIAAIVFSLRKPKIEKKVLIFLFSAIIMFFLNILRLYGVMFFGKNFGLSAGELFHEVSWISTAAFILILWYYFTKKITKTNKFNELI